MNRCHTKLPIWRKSVLGKCSNTIIKFKSKLYGITCAVLNRPVYNRIYKTKSPSLAASILMQCQAIKSLLIIDPVSQSHSKPGLMYVLIIYHVLHIKILQVKLKGWLNIYLVIAADCSCQTHTCKQACC